MQIQNRFIKGDRLVCIDVSKTPLLVKGKIYTVSGVDREFVTLQEMGDICWFAHRFGYPNTKNHSLTIPLLYN